MAIEWLSSAVIFLCGAFLVGAGSLRRSKSRARQFGLVASMFMGGFLMLFAIGLVAYDETTPFLQNILGTTASVMLSASLGSSVLMVQALSKSNGDE